MNNSRKGDKINKIEVLRFFLPLLIFCAVTLSVCFCLGNVGIIEGAEGEFASISRKMADTSDWITPRINGCKYFGERPAAFWVGALSIKLFGANEFCFRFPLAIAAGIAAVCVFFIGRMFFGTLTGILSVMILWSSLFFQFGFRFFTAEPFFMAAELLLVWFFFSYLNNPSKKYKYLFWIELAICFLFKGTLTFIPIAGLIAAALYTDQRYSIKQLLKFWPGWIIFVILGLSWHITVAIQNPNLYTFLIANELLVTVLMNPAKLFDYPFYTYFWLVPVMLFPWIGVTFSSIVEQSKEFKYAPTASYMILWFVFSFVFYCLCSMKNPGFMLQIVAPLAIISAESLRRTFFDHSDENSDKDSFKTARWHCIFIVALASFFGLLISFGGYKVIYSANLIGQIGIFGGIFWLFCALIVVAFILKGSRRGVLIIIASIVPGFLLFVFPYIHGNEPWCDGKMLPSKFAVINSLKNMPSNQELLFVNDMLDAWYFYTGKDISACGAQIDLARGFIQDKESVSIFPKEEKLKNLTPDSILVMRNSSFNETQTLVGKTLYSKKLKKENDWIVVQTIKPLLE